MLTEQMKLKPVNILARLRAAGRRQLSLRVNKSEVL